MKYYLLNLFLNNNSMLFYYFIYAHFTKCLGTMYYNYNVLYIGCLNVPYNKVSQCSNNNFEKSEMLHIKLICSIIPSKITIQLQN